MIKRFFKVIQCRKQDTTFVLDGKVVELSKKERRLARLALMIAEALPLLSFFLIMQHQEWLLSLPLDSLFGLVLITGLVVGIFGCGFLIAFVIYWFGMR